MQKPITSSVARGCPVMARSQAGAMSDGRASLPGRTVGFLFGAVAYLVFLGAFLYAIGFVEGMVVPKAIDDGTIVPAIEALIVNLLLMSLFAVQHSVMARKAFKQWWTQFVPHSVERSVYVLLASLALILLFWQWRPMPAIVWHVADPAAATALMALSFVGWLLVLTSTFLINHFELFGLHQVAANLAGRTLPEPRFKTPVLYKIVRHPIYLGFIVAFWAAPVMTVGHLLFAAVTTAYIFVGIFLEERDLVGLFGEEYKRYRAQVGMLIPFRRKVRPDSSVRGLIVGGVGDASPAPFCRALVPIDERGGARPCKERQRSELTKSVILVSRVGVSDPIRLALSRASGLRDVEAGQRHWILPDRARNRRHLGCVALTPRMPRAGDEARRAGPRRGRR